MGSIFKLIWELFLGVCLAFVCVSIMILVLYMIMASE